MKRLLLLFFLLINFRANSGSLERYFPHLMKAEGIIFTVTQFDLGGATKFGVAWKTFLWACQNAITKDCDKNKDSKITPSDLALTTQQDAKVIYNKMYWEQNYGNLIKNQAIAEIIVDQAINCGNGKRNRHIKAIQKFVKVRQDGKLGLKTVEAINRTDSKVLYSKIFKYRTNFYKSIGRGTQRKFLKGWLNRINNLKKIHEYEKYV